MQSNPQLPNPFQSGQTLSAKALEDLRRAVAWAIGKTVKEGPGIFLEERNGRVILSTGRQRRGQSSLKPFRIYQSNGNIMTIPMSAAMTGYTPDPETPSTLNWSLQFSVTNLALDNFEEDEEEPPVMTNPIGTSAMDDGEDPPGENTELFNGDVQADPATPQTYWRIPIIRDGVRVCNGGAFIEDVFCSGPRGPKVRLLGIS